VQRGHEAEKKVAAVTATVSSLPGVQSKEQDELFLHYLTIIGFFGCPTIALMCLVLLLGNKSMWNYCAVVYLIDGCELLIQSFNLPTILLLYLLCALWYRYGGHCDRMLCLFDCPCDGMIKLIGNWGFLRWIGYYFIVVCSSYMRPLDQEGGLILGWVGAGG
jgi:hypothetical protein